MKYFLKKLLGREIFRSMVLWATKFFLKICQTLRPLLLMYAPLRLYFRVK